MKKLSLLFSLLIIVVMVLSACTPAAVDTPAPVVATDVPPTAVPPTAVPPTAVPPTAVPPTEESTMAPEPAMDAAALKISGLVTTEMSWSDAEIKAMNTLDVESTNSKGEVASYTGVLLSELLALAGPKSDATTLVLVADDGFSAEVPLADVLACDKCILSFRSNGGFSSVLPDFAKNLQVKGVVEMQVK